MLSALSRRAWKTAAMLGAVAGMTIVAAPGVSAEVQQPAARAAFTDNSGIALSVLAPYEISVNAGSGVLYGAGLPEPSAASLSAQEEPVAAGTGPSVVAVAGLGYQSVFQGSNGHLWLSGTADIGDTTIPMAAGTSPSAVACPNFGYGFSWQGIDGYPYVTGANGPVNLGVPMAARTSPAVTVVSPSTSMPNGGWAIAVHGLNGHLWLITPNGATDTTLGMAPGTSPAIAALPSGLLWQAGLAGRVGFQVAWDGADGNVWTSQSHGFVDSGIAMAPGASPSLIHWTIPVQLADGGYEAAFRGSNGNLWTLGSLTDGDTGLPVLAQTNPSIAASIIPNASASPVADYKIAYASPSGNGEVFIEDGQSGPASAADTGTSVASGTSPSLTTLSS
jgi:hypothetical protein